MDFPQNKNKMSVFLKCLLYHHIEVKSLFHIYAHVQLMIIGEIKIIHQVQYKELIYEQFIA